MTAILAMSPAAKFALAALFIIVFLLVCGYIWSRFLIAAELTRMAEDYARSRPKPVLEPWEDITVNGGIYDVERDGSDL